MSRVGVAVELWTETAPRAIHDAAGFAESLAMPWTVIVVADLTRLNAQQRLRVAENTALISSLGGTPFFCEGRDVANAILAAARLAGVDVLLLATSDGVSSNA